MLWAIGKKTDGKIKEKRGSKRGKGGKDCK
jgi:hypothetical protein